MIHAPRRLGRLEVHPSQTPGDIDDFTDSIQKANGDQKISRVIKYLLDF